MIRRPQLSWAGGLSVVAPPAVLGVWLAVYEPVALLLAAPWLLALLWVVVRLGAGRASDAPSMAEAARRRLSVR